MKLKMLFLDQNALLENIQPDMVVSEVRISYGFTQVVRNYRKSQIIP